LSCPALPIIRLKTSHQLIIISFDLHPHQLCSDLNHEEQQGGAMKGEEEHWDNTPSPHMMSPSSCMHFTVSAGDLFFLWQILGIFGNVLEWKNVFSVHLNFVISEEFSFAILVILFLKIA
jgi:hypothetical protein